MAGIGDGRDGFVSLSHVCYLVPPLALAWHTNGLRGAAFLVLPVLTWSWLQDWLSCLTADAFYRGRLALFDICTAANYVALARTLETIPHAKWQLPAAFCVHWAILFAIYIAWNLRLARQADPPTRRMLYAFSAVELGAVGMAVTLALMSAGDDADGTVYAAVGGALLALHVGLLTAWWWTSHTREDRRVSG